MRERIVAATCDRDQLLSDVFVFDLANAQQVGTFASVHRSNDLPQCSQLLAERSPIPTVGRRVFQIGSDL